MRFNNVSSVGRTVGETRRVYEQPAQAFMTAIVSTIISTGSVLLIAANKACALRWPVI